jgi:TPR repeat protein
MSVAERIFQKAQEAAGIAASNGDVNAEFSLGISYSRGQGINKDFVEGLKWFQKAADGGSVPCMTIIAECYY